MKRYIPIVAALAELTGTAVAADSPGNSPAKSKVTQVGYDWSGWYIGGEGGYAFRGNAEGSVGPFGGPGSPSFGADYSIKGWLYGGKLGAQDYIAGTNLTFGLEAFIDKADIDGSGAVSNTGGLVTASGKIKWFSGAHAKLGYAWNNLLPHVTVGGACAQNDLTLSAPGGSTTSNNYWSCGWSAGAGLDWAFTKNLILGVSYLHADLGNANPSFPVAPGVGVSVPSNRDLDIVKVSASWKH